MFEALNPVVEHMGVRVGDKVRLIGVAMADDVGKVVKIRPDKFFNNELAFDVELRNSLNYDELENWYPIYRNELELL